MTRNARHLEILIGIILMILGLLLAYGVYWSINSWLEIFERQSNHDWEISWHKVALNWHISVIVSFLFLFGGIFLILSKKIGWYLALIPSIFHCITWAIFPWVSDEEEISNNYYWIACSISLFFALIAVFGISRPVRKKYSTTKTSFLYVFIGVSLLLLDQYISRAFSF